MQSAVNNDMKNETIIYYTGIYRIYVCAIF